MLKKLLMASLLSATVAISADSVANADVHIESIPKEIVDVATKVNFTGEKQKAFMDGYLKQNRRINSEEYEIPYIAGEILRDLYDKGGEDGFYGRQNKNPRKEDPAKGFYEAGYNAGKLRQEKRK